MVAVVALVAVLQGDVGGVVQRTTDGVFETAELSIRVVTVATGLSHPYGLAFLPDGRMLVTERAGRLRVVTGDGFDPLSVSGLPDIHAVDQLGLMDVAIHPGFANNQLVYFTYTKPGPAGSTTALGRGRLSGTRLADVEDLFVAEPWMPEAVSCASRIAFAPDGTVFMTIGGAVVTSRDRERAQDPADHVGKILRLHDDGRVPVDNPFVGRTGYHPEIYSLGHRNQLGLAIHPPTGVVWSHEQGPQGGDEVNVILPGRNYGWPIVTYGAEYSGDRITTERTRDGMEDPLLFWVPSIAASGMAFYTGDRFPAWWGDLLVGSLGAGGFTRTGHLQRVVFGENGLPVRRESILTELGYRIRDVRQGPDGLVFLLTDEDDAVLLRVEPA